MTLKNPVTLRIGYRKYKMRFVKRIDKGKTRGECYNPSSHKLELGLLKISGGMDSTDKAATILHEIAHAIIYTQGLELSDKTEEKFVLAMTNGLTGFIKDNPKFFSKIVRMIQKEK